MKRFFIAISFILFTSASYGVVDTDPSCKTCTYVAGSMLQYMQVTGMYSVTLDQLKTAGRQYCQQQVGLLNCSSFVETESSRMLESFRNGKSRTEGLCVQWGYCRCEAETYFVDDGFGGFCQTCPDGTYSGGDGETTCSSCPEPGTTSSKYGKISVFNCYIPAEQEFQDSVGTWIYTEDCMFNPV